MKKLTNRADIKKYIMFTIRTGNKQRIEQVLKRYWQTLKKDNSYKEALEIFKTK